MSECGVADLPDCPCWVDARWLLASGTADVVACASGAVAVGRTLPLGAVLARPGPGVLRTVAERASPDFELVVQEADAAHVRAALPSWRFVWARIHVRPSGPARGAVPPQVRVSAPPDRALVRRLGGEGGRWAAPAQAIAVWLEAGRPVALCHATVVTPRWWDVGVETDEGYRRRGYAAATFEALAAHMAGTGRRPVWGAGAHNTASLRLAARLGFRPYGRVAVLAPPVARAGQPAGARAPGGAAPKGGPLVGVDTDG